MPYRDGAEGRAGPIAPLDVEIGTDSESQFYADISGAVIGVFASTFLVLLADTEVNLVVSISYLGSFEARGVVRFIRTANGDQLPGVGVAFSQIEPSDLAEVVRFCEVSRAPMLYEEG